MRVPAYLKLLLTPWRYDDSLPLKELTERLQQLYTDRPAGGGARRPAVCLTVNGRTALYLILRSLPSSSGDEVIVQSFTCLAAVNPILWAALQPVFVDIERSNLGMAPSMVAARITDRTRAIIVQHTFGMLCDIEEIAALARQHGIPLIEDCAHTLGTPRGRRAPGTYADAAVLSFGIEKVLPTKAGGALLVNNPALQPSVESAYRGLSMMSRAETFRWLLYPLLRIGLRRIPDTIARHIAYGLARLGALRQAVSPAELHGEWPPGAPSRLSGALAAVVLTELVGLDVNLAHRASICRCYVGLLNNVGRVEVPRINDEPLIQFPVICETPRLRDRLRAELMGAGIPVTTWYDPPIYPRGADLEKLGYQPSLVPVAEDIARRVLCLPTGRHINLRYATEIAQRLIDTANRVEGATERVSGTV